MICLIVIDEWLRVVYTRDLSFTQNQLISFHIFSQPILLHKSQWILFHTFYRSIYIFCIFQTNFCQICSPLAKVQIQVDGILPRGPYPLCLRMADRALLAGYPRDVPFVDAQNTGNMYYMSSSCVTTKNIYSLFSFVFQRSVGLPDIHSGYGFAIGKSQTLNTLRPRQNGRH